MERGRGLGVGFAQKARCWVLKIRLRFFGAVQMLMCLVLGVCGVWVRSLFENFTVDASIFVDQFLSCCIFFGYFDKLLSAVGGCLGTKSR